MQPKSALRLLLREIDRHVTSVAGNTQWRQHVLAQFRANAGVADASQQQQLVLLAKEYADLISNIAHHQGLLNTYNIGVDPDERNKEMVAKTAARVGFQLPQAGQKPAQSDTQQQQHRHHQQQQQQQQQGKLQDQLQQQPAEEVLQNYQHQQQQGFGDSKSQHVVAASSLVKHDAVAETAQQQQQQQRQHIGQDCKRR